VRQSSVADTAVTVTDLGFGAAPIGNLYRAIDDETARAAVATAWDGGIRYFDTAPHYGLGLSERRLGAALAAYPRAEFTISTKVGRLLVPNDAPTGSDLESGGFAVSDTLSRRYDYSRDGVRRSLEASLQRLGVDHVEIVYVHDPEDHMDVAVLEAVPALVALREEGVIGAVGVGMNFVEPLRRFVSETDIDLIMVAGRWTLVDRSAATLLQDCLDRRVAVVSAAPFNSGLLSRPDPPDDAHFDYGPAPPDVLAAARACAAACAAHGTTLPVAALQFPLLHPAVCSVVAGMRTAEQCALNLQWAAAEIDPSRWDVLPEPARTDL
jgi:D-threo-aldose 1-dehydrogenase